MAGRASQENGRKGGRPKGARSAATLEREATEKAVRERIWRNADRLVDSLLSVAHGVSFLYRVDDDAGKGKKKERRHVLVTSPDEIKRYLDGDTEPDQYYYITTERPDVRAIDTSFDRAFGKARQSVDVTSGGRRIFVPGSDLPDFSPSAPVE